MILGLDTGFFVRLLQEHEGAWGTWRRIVDEEDSGVVSCLSLYELAKLGLKGGLSREASQTLVAELPNVCRVVWIDEPDLLDRAARVSHGAGLSMADAVILASLLRSEVDEIHTTDRDLIRYQGGPRVVGL